MMTLTEYLQGQMREAASAENKWYCSQHYGYEVNDPKVLLEYYIRHGGTLQFALLHQKELVARSA